MDNFIRYNFPLAGLALKTDEIVMQTGPGFEEEIIRINELFKKTDAQAGYTVLEKSSVTLDMGTKVSKVFEKAEKIALFVLTLGREYENIAETYRGDALLYYLTDLIASEYTEVVADALIKKIATYASESGLGYSNRYSPGYCGWRVSGQRALFSYLPPFPCGVELSESCLMKPVKSISGAVAMGERIKFQKYDCGICKDEGCLYRKKYIL